MKHIATGLAFLAASAMALAAPKDVDRPPADAKRTFSGLRYKILKAVTGREHPEAISSVPVHYSGGTTDGTLVDSSYSRRKPKTVRLNRVIRGWTEGLQLMVVGEKCRFWIPQALAYAGKGPVAGDLVFDVELISIN
jgi:FKBP-type peptidyl-prolyl cis-trans isomerase